MKLEDTFAEHPKVELAGDQAAWMYVAGLLYAYRADTDGFVPSAKVAKLTGFSRPQKLAERLVEVRLWEAVEDGFVIHDYLDHQQSSVEREQVRAASAERLRKHRAKNKGNGDVTPLHARFDPVAKRLRNGDVTTPEGEREGEELPNDNDYPAAEHRR